MMHLKIGTLSFVVGGLMAGCSALGLGASLSDDCSAQAVAISQATANVDKLMTAERAAIDTQIALSKGYCSGAVPATSSAAAWVVERATAQIVAIVAIASARK